MFICYHPIEYVTHWPPEPDYQVICPLSMSHKCMGNRYECKSFHRDTRDPGSGKGRAQRLCLLPPNPPAQALGKIAVMPKMCVKLETCPSGYRSFFFFFWCKTDSLFIFFSHCTARGSGYPYMYTVNYILSQYLLAFRSECKPCA